MISSKRLLFLGSLLPSLVLAQVIKSSAVDQSGNSLVPLLAPDFKVYQGDVGVYADPVNGNDSWPGTQTLPKRTFQAAIEAVPNFWTGKCRVNLTAGTFSITGSYTVRFGTPLGPKGEPCAIQGTMIDSGLGQRTITGVTVGTSSAVIKVQDSTLSLTLNQYDTYFLRFTTGAAAGYVRIVTGNTVDGNFSMNAGDNGASARPVVGDKFVIESPGSIISGQGNGNYLFLSGTRPKGFASLILYKLKFTGIAVTTEEGVNTFLYVTYFDGTGSVSFSFGGAARHQVGYVGVAPAWIPNSAEDIIANIALNGAGAVFASSSGSPSVGIGGPGYILNAYVVIRSFYLATFSGLGNTTYLWNPDVKGTTLFVSPYGYMAIIATKGMGGQIVGSTSGSECIDVAGASYLGITGPFSITNCVTNGVTVENGAFMKYSNVSGSGSGGAGVLVNHWGHVLEGANNTVTGTAGDLKAGSTVATHAAVYGGTPLNDTVGGTVAK